MPSRTRKITNDIVIRDGVLIVRDPAAQWRWLNESSDKLGIPPEKRLPLYIGIAEHIRHLTPAQTASLREQMERAQS